jgi:predicted CXXCH cytochrome family protein
MSVLGRAAMGLVLALGALAAGGRPAAAQPAAEADGCTTCHLETGDDRLAEPARRYAEDIHRAKGFGCVACHGGDGTAPGPEAMDPAKGYIGVPRHRQVIQVCGRCHSDATFMRRYNPSLRVDQVAEYVTSVHGRRLRQLGDPKVATCASCHHAHSIKPRSDATSSVHPLNVAKTCGTCHADAKYMAGYRIPTDQLDKYTKSVHWHTLSVKGDLAAPTCNSCHGNHGASPPGVGWVGNVCGQCHTVIAELFAKSVHARVFREMGTPGCATCHQNHDIQPASPTMVGVDDQAVCAACHAAGDAGGAAAGEMRALLDRARREQGAAAALLERAEHAGMEVSQARFDLNGATDAIVKARTAVHTFTVAAVRTEAESALAVSAKAHARGVRALDDLRFRRQGLVVSLVIILALIGGLVVKIRQIDRAGPPPHAP